jgi:hypothetical protein
LNTVQSLSKAALPAQSRWGGFLFALPTVERGWKVAPMWQASLRKPESQRKGPAGKRERRLFGKQEEAFNPGMSPTAIEGFRVSAFGLISTALPIL